MLRRAFLRARITATLWEFRRAATVISGIFKLTLSIRSCRPDRTARPGGVAAALLAAVALCLASACAVPDVDKAIADSTRMAAAAPQIQGARGPLSARAGETLLASLDLGAGSDLLRRHLAIEEAIADGPLTAHNRVDVLSDGPETFRAVLEAIRGARRNLDLEYYTIEDVTFDEDPGKVIALSDLLIAKRREGVEVNILYDSFGSSDTPPEFFERLARAGINLLEYHPIDPINPANWFTLNRRDHRKILVADGRVGMVGGINLSKSYESKIPGSDDEGAGAGKEEADGAEAPADVPREWRDMAVRIEGPAARELQGLFHAHWASENGPPLPPFEPAAAAIQAGGSQIVRIVGSAPADDIPRYYVTLISAMRSAEARIWVTAAYFVPTAEAKEALIAAAQRGIDVRLLLAGNSDADEVIAAGRTHYSDLLEAGIKIYEVEDAFLHSKAVVIDGVWSAVGSSNFDHRSVLYNDEVDAIVLGPETARELERIFERDARIATEIEPGSWERSRLFGARLRGFFMRIGEHLL